MVDSIGRKTGDADGSPPDCTYSSMEKAIPDLVHSRFACDKSIRVEREISRQLARIACGAAMREGSIEESTRGQKI